MRKCSQMPYHVGIVLRIYPSRRQKHIIAVNDGCERAVYNKLVALNNERHQLACAEESVPAYHKRLEYLDSILQNPDVTLSAAIKNILPFLRGTDVDLQTVENAIKNYRAAWKKFRETHTGVPTFHKKSYEQSYQTNCHYKSDARGMADGSVRFIDSSHIILPVIGKIRCSGSAKRIADIMYRLDTRIGTVMIRKDSVGRYFASLQLASENPFVERYPATGAMIGIDLNIDNFLWDSNNRVVANPKYRRDVRHEIASLQRSMSRKAVQAKKQNRSLSDCHNYQKDRVRLAKLQSKVAGRSDNFRHVISKDLVENQDFIFAEDLKVSNLLKNHRLAFAISESGWSDFLAKLEYKSAMHGKMFLKVPPHHTTQTCSSCGHVLSGDEKLTLSDREWVCPVCGTYHIRDYNAAKNILARGLAAMGMTADYEV